MAYNICFSFANDWPVVSSNKWNPMEYWNRSGATTTQAATVSTSGKPTTSAPTSPGLTSGEPKILNVSSLLLPLYSILYH